jgi:uncharacterized repeat protein (TIGR03943 family)
LRVSGFFRRWFGSIIVLAGALSTLWLALSGKLTLYVHPRYEFFTVSLGVIAGVIAVASMLVAQPLNNEEHEHEHEHGTIARKKSYSRAWAMAGTVGVTGLAIAMLLIAPPATLSTTIAGQRDVAESSARIGSSSAQNLVGADTSAFTVKDWAVLLSSGDPAAITGKAVSITGFVIDTTDADVFFVARYLISCCAVDAQPVGVPVYAPGWQALAPVGTWVDVTGVISSAPDASIAPDLVVLPTSVMVIPEPGNPYVY